MKLMPRSLAGRLLLVSAVAGVIALAIAAVAIGGVLERFVLHGLDQVLDRQIAVVARAVRVDGSLDPAQAPDLPPFDAPGGGWAWEVRAPGGTLRSRSLGGRDIVATRRPHGPPPREELAPRPFDDEGVHGRVLALPTAAGPATILATAPRAIAERPLRAAMAPLLAALAALAIGLAAAVLVQLRIGLRPLKDIGAMLGEVRAGRRATIDADPPTELAPLVAELNALIAANAEALERARGNVANLAHGLKTPLATLRLDLAGAGDTAAVAQVERIERQIRHHLGRARAATPAGMARPGIALRPQVVDLVDAIGRIHAERAVTGTITIDPAILVRCDRQDLDEMLGNLIDNAWRWAAGTVSVTATTGDRQVAIAIRDDGPGLDPDHIATAMRPGQRLDETGDGFGFGLAISRELAELSGGTLSFAATQNRGTAIILSLPIAVSAIGESPIRTC